MPGPQDEMGCAARGSAGVGACVEECGAAAAAAARRCMAEAHGWHASGSCGLPGRQKVHAVKPNSPAEQ
eukprot:scaffold18955_cov62-Phaeocystis_antarctica.AAC.3